MNPQSSEQDLSRQIVKTEWAEISIPEVEFDVKKQTGLITTIEGIIDRALEGLTQTVKDYRDSDPENVLKLSQFLLSLVELKDGQKEFTFVSIPSLIQVILIN